MLEHGSAGPSPAWTRGGGSPLARIALAFVLLSSIGFAPGERRPPPRLEVTTEDAWLDFDGVVSDDEWARAAHVSHWLPARSAADRSSGLWIDANDRTLRIAVRVPVPEQGGLLTRAARRAREDTLAPLDDSIELWLASEPASGQRRALRLVFNARAATWDAGGEWLGDGWAWDSAGSSRTRVATRVHEGQWEAEIVVPRSELAAGRRQPIDTYALRVVRQSRRPSVRSAWPALGSGAEPMEGAARIVVRRDAIVVSARSDAIGVHSHVPTPVDLRLRAIPSEGCERIEARVLRLDGGRAERVALPEACARRAPIVEIRDASDETLRFRGWLSAAGAEPAARAHRDVGRVRGVRLDVAWYPYASKLRWRIDPAGARPPLPPGPIEIRVYGPRGDRALASEVATLDPAHVLEGEIALPPLADGPHRVIATIGEANASDVVVRSGFTHRTFGWEHNDLGLEPEVFPPFEPLRVEGRDVHAVLRRHSVGVAGLPGEIDSLETPLLTAPLRFEVGLGGEGARAVEPVGAPRFEQPSPGRIDYESDWRAGALRATTRARMEVDGLLWIDVELPEQPGVVVERLDLVIPVREDVAQLMNVVTDRTRHNESGAVPSGEGIVWRSTEARRVELPGSFVPYVWLGDGARGLAFVAAGDRDWAPPPDAAVQVLEREGASVTLRVRLIGRPVALDRARRLAFGLQATPTKPRPFAPTWRLWQPTCRATPVVSRLCILATTWEWGGASAYGSFAPAPGNEGVLADLAAARATGTVPDGAVERWLDRRESSHPRPETVRRSLEKGFSGLATRPDGVVAYVSAHTVGPVPELEVYRDEWSPAPFSDGGHSPLAVEDLVPTFPGRSWQDFALWHLAKLLDSGAVDGFYIDNTFLRAVFDETSGAAHRDEAGRLRPTTDLLELRSFMRRLQTLAYQKRRRWLNVSHMTNTPVAPVQTWSAAMLDGELRYGPEPFSERFSREWIRAEATGDSVGTLPLFLPGVAGVEDRRQRERMERSVVAGAAVHEIRAWGGSGRLADEVWGPLHRFGYGRLDARVHRYWDPSPPFRLSGIDGEALVVVRDGEAIALVAAFGEGGSTGLALDGRAMGVDDSVSCRDAVTGRRLRSGARFRCDFLTPDHGYRLIAFERE